MNTADTTIRQLILAARKTLETAGVDEAGLNADYLAAQLLHTDRGRLPLHWHDIADNSFITEYAKLIERRTNREPLQYIMENWDFLDLSLKTVKGTLIPRPDTEPLVLSVIEQIENKNTPPLTFIDVCSGSGAIGLALAKRWPNSYGLLLDICPNSVCLSRFNAQQNELNNISVLCTDMLSAINPESVDLVISNPPYIPTQDIYDLMPEVKNYEPHKALDGGLDGFDFIKILIKQAHKVLKPAGLLAFEHGWDQQKQAIELLSDNWQVLQAGQDLRLKDRFIICVKK